MSDEELFVPSGVGAFEPPKLISKPDDVTICQIAATEYYVYGLGTDQKIYFWRDDRWVK